MSVITESFSWDFFCFPAIVPGPKDIHGDTETYSDIEKTEDSKPNQANEIERDDVVKQKSPISDFITDKNVRAR